MQVNQVERAFRAWPILIQRAKQKRTITYKALGDEIGIHHRAIRYVLSVIQDYCLEEKIPPLTILIVNASGKPGDGFIAYDLRNFDDGLQEVYEFNWVDHGNPFGFSQDGLSYPEIIKSLINDPDSSGYIYAKIKSRGIKQILFRDSVLKAYSYKCAFTGLSFIAGLEAAHIIPWKNATDAQRLDVRNGILLNAFHHKLFDSGLITITTDYKIKYFDPREEDDAHSSMDSLMSSKLHNKLINLPHRLKQRPLSDYISAHHIIQGWEQ